MASFQAAAYLVFVVLYLSPSCFGPLVDKIAVSGGIDARLGTVHLQVGALPVDPNLNFQVKLEAYIARQVRVSVQVLQLQQLINDALQTMCRAYVSYQW